MQKDFNVPLYIACSIKNNQQQQFPFQQLFFHQIKIIELSITINPTNKQVKLRLLPRKKKCILFSKSNISFKWRFKKEQKERYLIKNIVLTDFL